MNQKSGRVYARAAGFLYLLIALIGGFSIGYMPSEIIAEGNASLTFQNLVHHQELFRWGIVGDITVLVLEVFLTVILYQLLKSVSSTGMIIAAFTRLAMAIIMGMNLMNYMAPAIIMHRPEYLHSFGFNELEAINLLFLTMHKYGELIWQVFFSIHLFILGYVIQKLENAPKFLGVIMLAGSIGYAGDSLTQLILVHSEVLTIVFSLLLVVAVIAEFWFAFWLLLKGWNEKELVL